MEPITDPEPAYYEDLHVLEWLDLLDTSATPDEPPALSMSAPPRSSSPSKRKKASQPARESDEDELAAPATAAPTAAESPGPLVAIPLRQRPSGSRRSPTLRSSSRIHSGSTSESQLDTSRTSKSRSTSPVKHSLALLFLSKPVTFSRLATNPLAQLPADAHDLYKTCKRITKWKSGFIHAAARNIIVREVPDGAEWPDHCFRPSKEQDAEELEPWAESGDEVRGQDVEQLRAERQFRALRAIQVDAQRSLERERGELAWNNLVHSPLLQLAVQSVSGSEEGGVVCEPVMTAGIASRWLPEMMYDNKHAVAGGKMVDFALALDLWRPRPADLKLREAIYEAIRTQVDPEESLSVNQTNYQPLAFSPIGVSIETKSLLGAGQANAQFGVWTAAWHHRVRELLLLPPTERIITLPLLLCHLNSWDLYFACDRGKETEIVGPISLGQTDIFDSLYPLFAMLRELCKWVEGPFRKWWMVKFNLE